MRHHFGDSLDREDGYWTVVPNRERYAYRIGDVPPGSKDIRIATVGKEDANWSRVLSLPNLEELTLHEPTAEQLEAVRALSQVRRLRVTHARPRNLDFISAFEHLEELVLEYVSGVDDLAPIGGLPKLRALHLENLRRVVSFDGLRGAKNLRYLAIHGTLDWQQPIHDFEFLSDLPQLEVLRLWEIVCRAAYPAALPMRHLKNLKKLALHGSYLASEEYALIEECLPQTEGAQWGTYRTVPTSWLDVPRDDLRSRLPEEIIRKRHPEVIMRYDGRRQIPDPASCWYEFTGRGAGRVKCSSKTAEARCSAQEAKFAEMRQQAKGLLIDAL